MLLNILIFIPVFRLAFISKKSSVYLIAFFNIITDMLQLFVTCFYFSASIIADRYIFSGERLGALSVFFGWIFIDAWFMESLVQIVMSVNRFAVITLKKNDFFTFKNTLIIFGLMILVTSFSSCCIQYFFPCCQVIADYASLSYTFVEIDGQFSYSNLLVLFYDVICLIIPTICYVLVFLTIRKSNKSAPASVKKMRSNQDVKYLIQFVFISVFYLLTWMTFFILPLLAPNGPAEWYSIVPIFVSFNCSSNAVIFLIFNKEIQKSLGIPWLKIKIKGLSTVSSTIQVTSRASTNNT